MDANKLERLEKLGAVARPGKGAAPRRRVKKPAKAAPGSGGSVVDDRKLGTALKKLNVQPTFDIQEVNMFKRDGNVIHFEDPKGTSMHVRMPMRHQRYGFADWNEYSASKFISKYLCRQWQG